MRYPLTPSMMSLLIPLRADENSSMDVRPDQIVRGGNRLKLRTVQQFAPHFAIFWFLRLPRRTGIIACAANQDIGEMPRHSVWPVAADLGSACSK